MIDVETEWRGVAPALKRFILRRVSDQAAAEDIFQEVFLKIQSRIGTLRDLSKFRPWLYRISRNTIIDHYRSRRPLTELPEEVESRDDQPDDGPEGDIASCVKEMVDRLPERYRQAVYLTAYQGLTQKEMGQELGISLSGAKSRVQRARERLKGMLLDCCCFELDRLGGVISYEPRERGEGLSPELIQPLSLKEGHG